MQETLEFQVAVHKARQRDPRFARNAYAFLCDVLPHTVKMLHREESECQHVNGAELLEGWRDLAVREFGPLAGLVMAEWGVRCSEDVGAMVFHFIDIKFFGKNNSDRIEDFSDGVNMEEALRKPFLPARCRRRA